MYFITKEAVARKASEKEAAIKYIFLSSLNLANFMQKTRAMELVTCFAWATS
jgi:hypothetical protein